MDNVNTQTNSDIAFRKTISGRYEVIIHGALSAYMDELTFAYFIVGASTCMKSIYDMDSQTYVAGTMKQLFY